MKKRILAGALALIMAAGVMAPAGDVSAASVATKAKKALVKKAESIAISEAEAYEMPTTYGLYDMDGDGVKELIFAYVGNREGIAVYRYDKTKKKVVQSKLKGKKSGMDSVISGVTVIVKEKKGFTVATSDGALYGGAATYTLNKKRNLTKSNVYTWDFEKNKFKKDGKKITEKKLDAYLKKVYAKKDLKHSTKVEEADRIINRSVLDRHLSDYNLSSIFADYEEYTTYDVTLTTYDLTGKENSKKVTRSYVKGESFGETKIGKFDLADMARLDTEDLDRFEDRSGVDGSVVYYTVSRGSNLAIITDGAVDYPSDTDVERYQIYGEYLVENWGMNLASATFYLYDRQTDTKTLVAQYEFIRAVG